MQLIDMEDAHRAQSNQQKSEPSTAELQQFVHNLQELAVSPSLLSLHQQCSNRGEPPPIVGGAHVKRLQALIAQRRRLTPAPFSNLNPVPESANAVSAAQPVSLVADVQHFNGITCATSKTS